LRRLLARAALPDEGVMQADVIHLSRPDQQRICCVGSALVAVPAAFYDQAQMVITRKIDRGDNICRVLGGDRVDTRLRGPGIDPATGLRQSRLVAEVVRVF